MNNEQVVEDTYNKLLKCPSCGKVHAGCVYKGIKEDRCYSCCVLLDKEGRL